VNSLAVSGPWAAAGLKSVSVSGGAGGDTVNIGSLAPEVGGIAGGIGGGDTARVTFYIHVSDIDSYLRQIEANGGKTIVPRTVIPDIVTFANFADPQGNVVGLVEGQI
jgi:predicted enzyme related to lactoylglutathione lyase